MSRSRGSIAPAGSGSASSSFPSRRAAAPSWSPPTASTRDSGWPIGSPFSRAVASCSTGPRPSSATTTCAGSTTISPSVRGSSREPLRASRVDRGVEGRAERAAEQGEPQRPRVLFPPPPLRVPVRPGAGAREGGDCAAWIALARPRPRPRRQVRHLSGQARRQRAAHGGGGSCARAPLRPLLQSRLHQRAARAGARPRPRHPGAGRGRHALRRHHRPASCPRTTFPRPPPPRRRPRAAGLGERHANRAPRRAAGGRGGMAQAARRGGPRLSRDRRAHLRVRAGGLMAVRVLGWLAVLGLVAGLVAAFGYAPREVVQGNVQRIVYLHVPSVLTAYLAFALVFVGSVGYLLTRRAGWDRLAVAAAEPGVIFTGITIASGSIWGKPTWGTWWTWDARLTSTAVLFLVYLGYLLLRGLIDEPDRRARAAAVVGILGAANIPIVHFSVKWWRALHQPATILGPEPSPIAAPIALTLFVNWLAFTLLFLYLLAKRTAIAQLEEHHAE